MSSPLAGLASKTGSARMAVRRLVEPLTMFALTLLIVVSYDEFKKATEAELQPMRVHEGTLGTCISSRVPTSTC